MARGGGAYGDAEERGDCGVLAGLVMALVEAAIFPVAPRIAALAPVAAVVAARMVGAPGLDVVAALVIARVMVIAGECGVGKPGADEGGCGDARLWACA